MGNVTILENCANRRFPNSEEQAQKSSNNATVNVHTVLITKSPVLAIVNINKSATAQKEKNLARRSFRESLS